MTTEQWKPYVHNNRYHISDRGRVTGVGGYLVGRKNNKGQRVFSVTIDGRTKVVLVARALLETFVGPCPHEGWCAAHKDKNTDNENLWNLEWQHPDQVLRELTSTGHRARGERSHNAVLTEDIVREARMIWARDACTIASLAKKYGVSTAVMSFALNRKTWKHVD